MTPCGRPGCAGTIVDGYCDTCGLAPAKGAASSAGTTASERVDVTRLTTRSATSTRSHRSRIGAGVVDVAPVTVIDPATIVMTDPTVPEEHRYCARCNAAVGRSKDQHHGRQSGFCPNCGAQFDFGAKLKPHDLVAGQYEVAGALAHGGLGWIYLARDRNVSGRWCVLKGLLDAADPDAAEAAVAERRFLAEVAHPAIVEIYNFVNHDGQGYIVMQYVGGPSLKQLAKERRQQGGGAMPFVEAAAYVLAVLPALAYLHERGLLYCDFKPDNVIHVGDAVKLIDLGGVRRWDDDTAAIFGTAGYQAPEVADTGPTVASDLYTVGRALGVLTLDWPEWQRRDLNQVPHRAEHPLLVQHDCLWRFLQRACASNPADRFADAEEMADALHGVLCQVAAAGDGEPRPRTSTRFGPPRPRLSALEWQSLAIPLLPAHPRLANHLAGVAGDDVGAAMAVLTGGGELSWSDTAAVTRSECEAGHFANAHTLIDQFDTASEDAAGLESVLTTAQTYLRGVALMASGDATGAAVQFDAAYRSAPGEAACALARAVALEASGDATHLEEAADLYEQIAVADPSWVMAVAGLARVLVAMQRPMDAARVLVAVPESHPSRAEALTLACRVMASSGYDPVVAAAAGGRVATGRPGSRTAADAELAAAFFSAALEAVRRRETIGPSVGGVPATTSALAKAAESAMLDLADATPNRARRYELLDAAARSRPWTLW